MEINEPLEQYILQHTEPEDDLLGKIRRETYLHVLNPRMLSGPIQGKILQFLASMIAPQHILEIGTYTGYATICMARSLAENGRLDTIEINDELVDRAYQYFKEAGLTKKIKVHTGSALEILPYLNTTYDLIFIDGDKREYTSYYDLVFPILKTDGYIIADNTLWDGKVLDEDPDDFTKGIQQFNDCIAQDKRLEKMILPLRDGLSVIKKVSA